MNERRLSYFIIAVWTISTLAAAAFWVAVGYCVIHFIHKIW